MSLDSGLDVDHDEISHVSHVSSSSTRVDSLTEESVIQLDEIMVQKKVPELELPFRLKKVQSGATIDIYW